MLNARQQKEYDEAVRQYTNLTGWDYLENLPKPKTVKKANENIKQATNFVHDVYADVVNSVKDVR